MHFNAVLHLLLLLSVSVALALALPLALSHPHPLAFALSLALALGLLPLALPVLRDTLLLMAQRGGLTRRIFDSFVTLAFHLLQVPLCLS